MMVRMVALADEGEKGLVPDDCRQIEAMAHAWRGEMTEVESTARGLTKLSGT